MKAMVFAAGLGTRLRPLTNDRPKALVEVAGQSLLQRNIDKLLAAGCEKVVVNIHYFGEQIMANVEAMPNWKGKIIISDEREKILETGGGLLLAEPHLKDADFLVHNVDILTDLPIKDLMAKHKQQNAFLTVATRDRATSRYLLFDKETDILCGWTNIKTGEVKMARARTADQLVRRAYSGIAAYSSRIFDYLHGRAGEKFSIVDTWLKAAATEDIYSYHQSQGWWIDVGKPEMIAAAERLLTAK